MNNEAAGDSLRWEPPAASFVVILVPSQFFFLAFI